MPKREHAYWETDQRAYRAAQEARRSRRMKVRIRKILALQALGFRVVQQALNHFRVNGRLDLFPLHNQWHDTRLGTKGSAPDLVVFTKEWIKS